MSTGLMKRRVVVFTADRLASMHLGSTVSGVGTIVACPTGKVNAVEIERSVGARDRRRDAASGGRLNWRPRPMDRPTLTGPRSMETLSNPTPLDL